MNKVVITALLMALPEIIFAQTEMINSGVYEWEKLEVIKTERGEYRKIFDGPTSVFTNLEVHVTSLNPGQELLGSRIQTNAEELIIVKEGHVKQTINEDTKILGPGSVILLYSGDDHSMQNASDSRAVCYIIKWELPGEVDLQRLETAAGSVMYDWNELEYKETNKGGSRNVIRRPTALLDEFEMHVTTLNEGIKSHDPHTHPAEEIILVKSGLVEEVINSIAYKAGPGSLIFLGLPSNHGIRNIGEGICEYYAFKWFPASPHRVQ